MDKTPPSPAMQKNGPRVSILRFGARYGVRTWRWTELTRLSCPAVAKELQHIAGSVV
jgi:hypothetical protein